ncbi:helix-turn-helix domain-containing protein [Actinomadura barringtoniae]|uniref:Helix-turn-helix domain-containing protein n=1 Tax=Actinomadura barringtoniae TaxID=1427535 RepID=A0A939PKV4_9ACTN|nr:helix-turn-helix transcriptional regulator [Actinomadura barringtoniae]MBO2454485.1 helix-turn-helix domain-containing protein [Actinomadura barringtoniae]
MEDGLGGFLKSRRARVTPESAGLPGGSRRRVPGLRREELAQLAGISVEYYQRLEQGRSQRPSPEVLNALARALSLDDVERAHLETLAAVPDHDPPVRAEAAVRPELERLLALMDRVPAMVITDRFDVLAANTLASRLFADALAGDGNLARYLYLDPAARDFYVHWDEIAATTAAQLRLVSGRHPRDRELAGLIADLSRESAEFRALWAAGDVDIRTSGGKDLRHPALGVLTLHYENFDAPGDPRQRLVTFTPAADTAAEAALQLLRTWAGTETETGTEGYAGVSMTGSPPR